jgi:hypothetical protein
LSTERICWWRWDERNSDAMPEEVTLMGLDGGTRNKARIMDKVGVETVDGMES